MTKHIIVGNFGNHSLAVLKYLHLKKIEEIHFCYIDTGWASKGWIEHVEKAVLYAKSLDVAVHCLKPQAQFSELVLARNQFPSRKFQWCASFLKGLTLISFLEELDPSSEALIVFGKRRGDALRFADLKEFEPESEHFEGRTLWHPLIDMGEHEFHTLIKETGFPLLAHASLECNPCIHSPMSMDEESLRRVKKLEQEIEKSMFDRPIDEIKAEPFKSGLQQFDLGCGAIFGCGE